MRTLKGIYREIVATLAAVTALMAFVFGGGGRDVQVEPVANRLKE